MSSDFLKEEVFVADFFIADTHFGHGNILKYCNRPFLSEVEKKNLENHVDFRVSRESIDLMDTTIIDNINKVVGRDDVLHHLGDFAFAPYEGVRKYRDRILCRNVFLTWGNHDRKDIADLFTGCHYQDIIRIKKQFMFKYHYPTMSWDGSYDGAWMLHGHVHGKCRKNPLMKALYDTMLIIDTGVDGVDGPGSDHTMGPWSVDEIAEWMSTKSRIVRSC